MAKRAGKQEDSPITLESLITADVPPQFHPFYVGLDIGYKFHVMSVIPAGAFVAPREPWKKAKAFKFTSDSAGISEMLLELQQVSSTPADFCIVLEPTGGHYGYAVSRILQERGYHLFYVENKAVKDFRERTLGVKEKSDPIDARTMAYMAFQKAALPSSMAGVRMMTPLTDGLLLFRSLMRDRWLLSVQLTRRKNQIQQLFAVTNPNLKSVFSKPGRLSVLKLALEYPTAEAIARASEEELRLSLLRAGARSVARKAAEQLKANNSSLSVGGNGHLVERQTWLIQEALRIAGAIDQLDQQIHDLLWGDADKGKAPHPYTALLFSLPTMSDVWACTLIGVIGDVERFTTYKQFTKYLGFAAEGAQSGTSVSKTRMTYDGVRDTRRVLFQIALTLIGPKMHNVFKAHYERLVARGMPKLKAMGHLSGKFAHVVYGCLKSGKAYDPQLHAAACGLPWDNRFARRAAPQDLELDLLDSESTLDP